MTVLVTLDIFSGRQNPTWTLSEEQVEQLQERVEAVEERTLAKPSGVLSKLGYRGLVVTTLGESSARDLNLYTHEGIIDFGQREVNRIARERNLETWLLETAEDRIEPAIRDFVSAEIASPVPSERELLERAAAVQCPSCKAADAPVYNPGPWNVPGVKPFNNCYNYANNKITNTFAQPGRAHGAGTSIMACNTVTKAAQADGLVVTPNFSGVLAAGKGWYVALVIWPNTDYHWYRQDKNGCWSHKPGQTAVRNFDNSGNKIADPKTCNRGPYTQFCTYMITKKTVVIR